MSELEVFRFPATGQQIQVVIIDGEPWFVARQVISVLGLTNLSEALRSLDADEVRDHDISSTDSMITKLVSEAGLYSLILRSRKPEAKAFKRWMTHEVLPTIRRTGGYQLAHQIPQTYAAALQLAADQAREIDDQRARLAVAEPKAEYVDSFVEATDDASTIRVFAGQLNVSEKSLREWLVGRKLIYRRVVGHRWSSANQRMEDEVEWLAYADYRAWFKPVDQPQAPRMHNGQMKTTLYVTPLGKVQIRRLLMKHPLEEPAA